MAQSPKTSERRVSLLSKVRPSIHEVSAAYKVSSSSLTVYVKAVKCALHWISFRNHNQTRHATILTNSVSLIIATKREKWNETSRLARDNVQISTAVTSMDQLFWTSWGTRSSRERMNHKRPGKSEGVKELETIPARTKNQGQQTIDRLEKKRGVEEV